MLVEFCVLGDLRPLFLGPPWFLVRLMAVLLAWRRKIFFPSSLESRTSSHQAQDQTGVAYGHRPLEGKKFLSSSLPLVSGKAYGRPSRLEEKSLFSSKLGEPHFFSSSLLLVSGKAYGRPSRLDEKSLFSFKLGETHLKPSGPRSDWGGLRSPPP